MLFEPQFVLYVDGASRGNPGDASYGFVIQDREGRVLFQRSRYIGRTTNNVAEYAALIQALEFALSKKMMSIEIRSDSQLLVRHLLGEYKVRAEGLKPYYEKCLQLLRRFELYEIKHIPREENRLADRIANEALDRRSAKKIAP